MRQPHLSKLLAAAGAALPERPDDHRIEGETSEDGETLEGRPTLPQDWALGEPSPAHLSDDEGVSPTLRDGSRADGSARRAPNPSFTRRRS
jgi:hypothetical protein